MFLHNLKYEIKAGLRVREMIVWLLIFPMGLGFFFKIAFDGIYESNDTFNSVPTAVVFTEENENLRTVLDGIEASDEPLMKLTYTDSEKAEDMLKNEEVEGVIYVDSEKLTLAVAGEGMYETILKAFCDQYNSTAAIVAETVKNDPTAVPAVIEQMSREINTVEDVKLVNGNTNYYTEYFYNLIAMVGLFGSLIGLSITIDNQANLSALGARKNCSPTPKSISVAASLVSRFITQSVCMVICVTFLRFVLQIDLGEHLLLVYLAAILSGMVGVSLGFMVGSIGRGSKDTKQSITTAVVMASCFCSGLMVGNMKAIIGAKIPFFNSINPASVISDSFHSLTVYDSYDRFIVKIITMAAMVFIFGFIGFIFTRRRKYASL